MITTKNPQKVYFDESGFTGDHLLDKKQNNFTYASVATDEDGAKNFVEYLLKKYKVQGNELKGKNLIKHNDGRKAIDEIFEHYKGKIKVSVSNKKYALAGKFFEYIFEPCISDISWLFYEINFHRFIANILYVEFTAQGAGAEEIFIEFEELMRTQDESKLQTLFNSSSHNDNSPILILIREFAQNQIEKIREDLLIRPGDGINKWILDLTGTALFFLLANWGQEFEQLTAICDKSKPLQDNLERYNTMIGRTDKQYIDIFGESRPITFNLSGPIQLINSKDSPGVQLADVISAACNYALSGTQNYHAKAWQQLPDIIIFESVNPSMEHVDLNKYEVQRNETILLELHSRASKGLSLYMGMPEFIENLS